MADGDSDTAAVLEVAIDQMRERGYAVRYRDRGERIHLIGVVCGREARNLLETGPSQTNSSKATGIVPMRLGGQDSESIHT